MVRIPREIREHYKDKIEIAKCKQCGWLVSIRPDRRPNPQCPHCRRWDPYIVRGNEASRENPSGFNRRVLTIPSDGIPRSQKGKRALWNKAIRLDPIFGEELLGKEDGDYVVRMPPVRRRKILLRIRCVRRPEPPKVSQEDNQAAKE